MCAQCCNRNRRPAVAATALPAGFLEIVSEGEKFITLTNIPPKPIPINQNRLDKLPEKVVWVQGRDHEKDFTDKALPADMVLQLKEGAGNVHIKKR